MRSRETFIIRHHSKQLLPLPLSCAGAQVGSPRMSNAVFRATLKAGQPIAHQEVSRVRNSSSALLAQPKASHIPSSVGTRYTGNTDIAVFLKRYLQSIWYDSTVLPGALFKTQLPSQTTWETSHGDSCAPSLKTKLCGKSGYQQNVCWMTTEQLKGVGKS